jgi:hypothetical protein
MQTSQRLPPYTRGCPECGGATERVARSLPDRALNLLMPVKRYRCGASGCGWEGLLMSRQRQPAGSARAGRPAAAAAVDTEPGRAPALIAFRSRGR